MRKITPLLFVFILIFSGVAHAAEATINAEGAAELKKLVEDDLQWRIDMSKIFDQGLAMEGKTTVTPKNGFYEVQLPHLSILAGPQGKLDIGAIILNVVPAGRSGPDINSGAGTAPQPGAWLIQQATLPPSMTFYDAQNTPVVHIMIGGQHFSATWLPAQAMFPKIDSLLQNIQINVVGEHAVTAKIGTLKSRNDLKDNGDGTWSGPVDFEATAVTVDVPGQNPVAVGIGRISSHNTYDRLNTSQSLKMKAVAEEALKGGLPQTDQEKKAFVSKLLIESPVSADGMSGGLELDKFFLHDTGTPQQPRRDIALDRLVLEGITTNAQQDKSKVFMKTGFDGLHVSFVPVALTDLLPHTMNIEITFDNMPVKDMMGQFFTVVQKSLAASTAAPDTDARKQAEGEAKTEMTAVAALLPKMLQAAGASVSVQNSFLKSNAMDTSLEARFDANDKAAMGATGKLTLSFRGLDEAVRNMQGAALKPGADPQIMGYLMGLMTVQTKGQPDKAADGRSIRNYGFELKKNGDILLNGVVINPRRVPVDGSQTPLPKGLHTHPMIPAPAPAQP